MTTISIKNEHGTFTVSGEAISSDEYLRLFIAAMVAASFNYEIIEDAIIEVADRSKE